MVISAKKVVAVSYELREDNAAGPVVEKTAADSPLVFLYGIGSMIPDFEKNLAGLKVGDTFAFGIQSENAYGKYDQQAVVDLPIQTFYVEGKLDTDILFLGNIVPMQTNDGRMMRGKVIAITADSVKMDFNHPMADKNLYFTGAVETVREASPEELAHGHVHGPGGHHH